MEQDNADDGSTTAALPREDGLEIGGGSGGGSEGDGDGGTGSGKNGATAVSEAAWAELLPLEHNWHKTVYTLQIIDALLLPAPVSTFFYRC